jgi:hypothetical protein
MRTLPERAAAPDPSMMRAFAMSVVAAVVGDGLERGAQAARAKTARAIRMAIGTVIFEGRLRQNTFGETPTSGRMLAAAEGP